MSAMYNKCEPHIYCDILHMWKKKNVFDHDYFTCTPTKTPHQLLKNFTASWLDDFGGKKGAHISSLSCKNKKGAHISSLSCKNILSHNHLSYT
jgi:hypothetical protein